MTLPIPTEMTAAVGGILTASQWNSNVRDGINYLANPPVFVGGQSAAQSIPASTYTAVNLDVETVDSYNGHSTSTNNSRYIAQVAGWYLIGSSHAVNAGSTRVGLTFGVNGVAATTEALFVPFSSTGIVGASRARLLFLNVGDYVETFAWQGTAGALTLSNVAVTIVWVHA